MKQEVNAFLNKFIASLCLHGVETIPFAGDEFQDGIKAVETALSEYLDEGDFIKISDIFVKVPVDETYQQIRTMFMNLNGQGIGFSGADNPMWRTMTIKMTPYAAQEELADTSVLNLDKDAMQRITEEFCEAAGVTIWEVF